MHLCASFKTAGRQAVCSTKVLHGLQRMAVRKKGDAPAIHHTSAMQEKRFFVAVNSSLTFLLQ